MANYSDTYIPLAAKYIDGIDLHKLDADEMKQLVNEWMAGLDVIKTLPNKRTEAATMLVTALNTVLLDKFTKINPNDKMSVVWAKQCLTIYQNTVTKLEKTDDSDILREALYINPLTAPNQQL